MLRSLDYIKQRQILWARRKGIELKGSDGERGLHIYAGRLEDNLYGELKGKSDELKAYKDAAGKELDSKMKALHSSSAIAVNVFAHWLNQPSKDAIAVALRIPSKNINSMRFEAQLPIMDNVNQVEFPNNPHLDVLFEYNGRKPEAVGIECKFATEAYSGRAHQAIRDPYMRYTKLWKGLSNLLDLAKEVRKKNEYHHLDTAQLTKHIFGLRHAFDNFRLVYLWYDVPFDEGMEHREEIRRFSEIVKEDGIIFQAITWQELIIHLAEKHKDEKEHRDYINYLVERYL
jgi:hypothetical protein